MKDLIKSPNSDKYRNKVYNLYGVIVHRGDLHSGHYIAYCYNQFSSEWVYYSDSTVRAGVAYESIELGSAYALFYELRDREELLRMIV